MFLGWLTATNRVGWSYHRSICVAVGAAPTWFSETRHHQQFLGVMQHFQEAHFSLSEFHQPENYRAVFSKELSAQTTMQYTSGSHRGIVNYNVAVDQKMSLSLCSSPEGPWRSMYQRLERSLKCCWQNRQRALHLCQSFSFEWFKLSRAQQELILAQGGSSTQRKRFTAICMLLYSSLIPGLSSCSWGSAGWNPGSAHTFHLVTTARCSALMTYRSPASWCTCEPSRC